MTNTPSFYRRADTDESGQLIPGNPCAVEPTGDYARDCAAGREMARELVGFMRLTGNVTMVQHTVRALVERGPSHQGLYVGFIHSIGEHARRGSQELVDA